MTQNRLAIAAFMLVLAVPASAAPVFFLDLFSSSGRMYLWARSDIRLAGVSLDIVEVGGAIKFTGAEVFNPNNRWAFLDGPRVVSDSAITNIGGAAIPGIVGSGIGAGSPEGSDVLLAAVDYMRTGFMDSQLFLRIGSNVVADWDGNAPLVHFGTRSSTPLRGDQVGAQGVVATTGYPTPPLIVDVGLGQRPVGALIEHAFMSQAFTSRPLSWSDLTVNGPGSPLIAPTLNADGTFSWDSHGSLLGVYTFDVTATNAFGRDVGRLTVEIVPEPTAISLFSLAIIGIVGRRQFYKT